MSKYRKLSKSTNQRLALLRNQSTALLYKGSIVTTEARAKEVRKMVEPLIAMAVREMDNTEEVTKSVKVARKDVNGKRVKEEKDGRKVAVFDEKEVTFKKDLPSRVHAKRQIRKVVYPVTEVPEEKKGRRRNTRTIDLVDKIFDEYAPKYADRQGGYTRIVKIGPRKGDGAMEVLLELV